MAFFEPLLLTLLFLTLLFLSYKDIKEGIIPNLTIFIIAILGLLYHKDAHVISAILLGGVACGLYKIYFLLKGKEGLGFGDVKLLTVSGFWLPLAQIPQFLVLAGILGILTSLIWRTFKNSLPFPFGPALALALGICIVGESYFLKGDYHMPLSFSGPHLSPASGNKPDSLVVLIHGYGANGDDLLSLGKAWAHLLPHTLFVAPHGPTVCEMNPSGNQWFDLRDWDPARILREVQALTPSFNHYLDELLKTHHLTSDKLALVGFSQGAMLALHIGLHRPPCAGVVAYSGGFLDDPQELLIAHPPVLLVHGTEDPVIPDASSQMAETRLKTLGVPVSLSLIPGLGHGIDPKGLELGGTFLKKHLDKDGQSDLWKQVKEGNN